MTRDPAPREMMYARRAPAFHFSVAGLLLFVGLIAVGLALVRLSAALGVILVVAITCGWISTGIARASQSRANRIAARADHLPLFAAVSFSTFVLASWWGSVFWIIGELFSDFAPEGFGATGIIVGAACGLILAIDVARHWTS